MDRRRHSRLHDAIEAIRRPGAKPEWAGNVCVACVVSLGVVDSAALTLRTAAKTLEVLGASDERAALVEDLQFTLGEGPGFVAFTTGKPVLVEDLQLEDQRWPMFVREGSTAGVAAVFAFPLRIGAIRFGTLDLYRTETGGLSPRALTDAAVLADLTSYAVVEHANQNPEGWRTSAVAYQDVNLATGMVASQLGLDLDDAFARLRAHAFAVGQPLLVVARDVLERRIKLEAGE